MSSSEWRKVSIRELCTKVSSGGTPSRRNNLYYENGIYNWVKTQELRDCNIYETDEKITEDALKNSSAKLYPVNTVTMAMYGATVGKLGILKIESATNQACCNMITDSKKLDYRFLYYSLINNREELVGLASGAAQQNLNVGVISNFRIGIPSVIEQTEIANTLSCLDRKIELNNRINDNLLQMAQAIYKSWFLDFEPFQDGEFEDSELGMIPKGWKVGKFENLVTVKYGKDHKKLSDGNIPVYGSGGVMRYVDKALCSSESVLIPRKGTLNNVIYVNDPFWSVDTMFFTQMNYPGIAKFVYFFIKSKDLLSMNAGSAVPSMTTEILNRLPIIEPPLSIIREFSELVTPFFIQMNLNNKQSENLANTRDALLPKLMSGEIRVPVEEV